MARAWLPTHGLCLAALAVALGSAVEARTAPGKPDPCASGTGAAYQLQLSASEAWLLGPCSTRLLELSPEIILAVTDPAARPSSHPEPLHSQVIRFGPWQVERRAAASFLLRRRASAGPLRYRLELEGKAGQLELRLESEALQTLAIRAEVLRLRSGPSLEAAVVDRSLRWTQLRGPSFAGSIDIQRLRLTRGAAQLTLVGGPGLEGLLVRPLAEGGGTALLELELDHEDNHPFHPLLACTRRLVPVKRGSLGMTVRTAGSRRELSALLLLGDSPMPVLGRYPRGAQGAFVLADHADQSSAHKLEALAFGATGAIEAGHVGSQFPGLVNRGLVYTKSVFVRQVRGYAHQLDSPAYRGLLQRLLRRGVELAIHSPSGALDRRKQLRQLLPQFRALSSGRTWIDHQPVTNCEAISNQGWDRRSRFFTLDLLVRAGLRHFWSAEDVKAPPGSLNLLWPEQPSTRHPIIYPFGLQPTSSPGQNGGGEGLWLFASSRFFVDRAELLGALREEALRRLEQEQGLFIGHVYLDTFKQSGKRFSDRSLLQFGDGPGRYRLRQDVDEVFQRLARHQAAGRLWVCGVDALIDHLSARAAVQVRPGSQPGELLLSSQASRRLSGLTLRLPQGIGRVSIDGAAPAVEHLRDGGEREIWLDLEPGQTRRLRMTIHPSAPAPLVLRESSHD